MRNSPLVLIAGGAGYVGAHSTLAFRERGWRVAVVDDLSTGRPDFAALADHFACIDLRNRQALARTLDRFAPDGILHCAARIEAGESVVRPLDYLDHNINSALPIVREAAARAIPFVFSSTAAVYGEPTEVPIPESHACIPVNPYGFSKFAVEYALRAAATAHSLRSVSLRYFNAAGADPGGRAGESHEPETHVIPNLLRAALSGGSLPFRLFGVDYPTRDGTCLRDYIHVADLASGHAAAFEYLWAGGQTCAVNLGSGHGTTVRELCAAVAHATGARFDVVDEPRRAGDPAVLLADITLARTTLGWRPERSDIDSILADALQWERHHRRSRPLRPRE
jgi:UDP-glucose-4-epimerase GalE